MMIIVDVINKGKCIVCGKEATDLLFCDDCNRKRKEIQMTRESKTLNKKICNIIMERELELAKKQAYRRICNIITEVSEVMCDNTKTLDGVSIDNYIFMSKENALARLMEHYRRDKLSQIISNISNKDPYEPMLVDGISIDNKKLIVI